VSNILYNIVWMNVYILCHKSFSYCFAQNLTAKHHEVEALNLSFRDEVKELIAKGYVVSESHILHSCGGE